MKEALILEGSLSHISLPDVMTFVSLLNKTGRLELHTPDGIEKDIFWKRGEVTFATSTDLNDSLGVYLLRNGKITQEQYEKSVKMLKPGVKHGKLLVRLGFLTPQDLWSSVKSQVLEIIYSCFSLREGRFYFYELPDSAVRHRIILSTSTTSLIMEGIRRLDEWARIKEKIPSHEMAFYRLPLSEEELEKFELSPLEKNVLDLISPENTVSDLIRLSHLSEFQTLRILLTLLHARLIRPVEMKEKEKEEEDIQVLRTIVEGYVHIFKDLFQELSQKEGKQKAQETMQTILQESVGNNELFEGVSFSPEGELNIQTLMANAGEIPPEQRVEVLEDMLNTFLGYLLFEVAQRVSTDEKQRLYREVSQKKADIDRLLVKI